MINREAVNEAAQNLEPLPQSVVRLANLVVCPEVDFDEVEEVVSFDQGLTVRLLKAANSVGSGARSEVGSMKMAISRLGTGNILSLAISACVKAKMAIALPPYDLGSGDLWSHSVLTALCSEEIRRVSEEEIPAESFTIALLHDVGKLILGPHLSADVVQTLRSVQEEGNLRFVDAEKQVLNIHHAEVGGLVAEQWGLPDSIVQGINYHHHSASAPDLSGTVVSVANAIARELGTNPDPGNLEFNGRADEVGSDLARLALDRKGFEEIGRTVAARFEEVSQKYN